MKVLLSGAAVALTFVAFLPYIRSIRGGRTRPPLYSWLIWGATALLVFLAHRHLRPARLPARQGAGARQHAGPAHHPLLQHRRRR